ncbi:hypothetical protein [Mycobacterium tuberculosis]|uniref:hypothetical protein n=1 Tax=Mycobacterium tuberculosis TaxID=1773 RepID=UPI000B1AC4F1|nr:hypothetical protein [Mycobacterium tuberculosis]
MHILYERCAFVDVGQDIIAVAVWVPGEGPDGRKTIKRTLCARTVPYTTLTLPKKREV